MKDRRRHVIRAAVSNELGLNSRVDRRTVMPGRPVDPRALRERPESYGRRVAAKLEEVIWQDWVTRSGVTTTSYTFVQAADGWLQLDDRSELDILVEILSLGSPLSLATTAGITFHIETAFQEQGPWNRLASYAGPTLVNLRLTSDPNAPYALARFLRYVIEGAEPWQATYRLSAYVPTGSGSIPFNDSDSSHQGEYLSPWTTYRGSVATTDTGDSVSVGVQSAAEQLGTDELAYLVLEPEITMLSGCTLLIESAFGEDGPFRTVAAYTQAYTQAQVIMAEVPYDASVKVLGRIIRTRVVAPTGNWVANYRVNAKWS
jgi:hypothetical protein